MLTKRKVNEMGTGITGQWTKHLRTFAKRNGIDPNTPEKQLVKIRQKTSKYQVPPTQDILDALKQIKGFEK